tara:strand:+ start:723 stop:935 length:213 start_codon:yes stop_codon:yes gene_type:complete
MSLDYEKRLLELRKLDYMEDYASIPEEKEQTFMRRRVVKEDKKDTKNPLQSFQELSFIDIMFQSKETMEV